jgi:Flp pilus assembly pilin Flp
VRERFAMFSLAIRLLARDPSGQTGAEYLGVLLVVAAIIVAIVATDPGQAISDELSEIVRDIAGER